MSAACFSCLVCWATWPPAWWSSKTSTWGPPPTSTFSTSPSQVFFSCSFLLNIFLHISIFTFLKFLHLQPYSRRPGYLGLGHARRALSHVAAISVDLWRGDFKIDVITIYSWILLYIIISVNLWEGDFIFGRTFVLCYTTISRIEILLYASKIYKLGFIFYSLPRPAIIFIVVFGRSSAT